MAQTNKKNIKTLVIATFYEVDVVHMLVCGNVYVGTLCRALIKLRGF
jgi:hypothetical protein